MPNTIRQPTLVDIPSLEVIRKQAMEDGFTDRYDRSNFAGLISTSNDNLREWISSDDKEVLAVETDITTIGFGAYDRSSARILALYTAPNYQGEGCASTLLEKFEHRARQDGRSQLAVTVPLNAIDFFEHRGFERQRTTEKDGLRMVSYTKSIS